MEETVSINGKAPELTAVEYLGSDGRRRRAEVKSDGSHWAFAFGSSPKNEQDVEAAVGSFLRSSSLCKNRKRVRARDSSDGPESGWDVIVECDSEPPIYIQVTRVIRQEDAAALSRKKVVAGDVEVAKCVEDVINAVLRKWNAADPSYVLLLDAREAPWTAMPKIRVAAVAEFSPPTERGFKEIWVVGPVEGATWRLR